MRLQNLACPYDHELTFLQKNQAVLIMSFENLNYSYYHEVKVSTKIRPFLYNHLKIRASPIFKSWNFCKNKAGLLRCFENLNYPYYY